MRIIQLTPEGMREVEYTETEHFVVTRQFLNNRERLLKVLMADEQPED